MHFDRQVKQLVGQSLGRVICETRKRKKISQEVLSKKVKVARNYLSMVEVGNRFLSVEVFIKIAHQLSANSAELLLKAAVMESGGVNVRQFLEKMLAEYDQIKPD